MITNHSPEETFSPRDFDGLILVADGCNSNNPEQVEINVIYQGDAWLLQACSATEARAWLADAQRLVSWMPPLLSADPERVSLNLSGLYEKPAFQIPPWVLHWKEIRHLDGVKDQATLDAILGIERASSDPVQNHEEDQESGPTQQVWFCEGCRTVGRVELPSQLDVFSAIYRIEDNHQQRSPDCQIPVAGTRVINTAIINSLSSLLADTSIPRWAIDPLANALGFQETPKAPEERTTPSAKTTTAVSVVRPEA